MGIYTDIQAALDTQLNAASLGIDIAYENVSYTPTTGTSWARATTLYSNTEMLTLDRIDLVKGIYQVDIFVEQEKGPAALNTLLDTLQASFKAQRKLTAGTHTIYIDEINRLPATQDSPFYMGSLEVAFRCHD